MKKIPKFHVAGVREHFPILKETIHGYPLVYFDNAATTHKPRKVIDAISDFYAHHNANVHRGLHALSVRATQDFELVREKVRRYINAKHINECIFLRGATEAINLVAQSFVFPRICPGEEILVTQMEHHANIVPWQMVCNKTGAKLKVVPISYEGEILIDQFKSLLSENVKFLALNYVSNSLGTINPVKELTRLAHEHGIMVLLDGAQASAHLPIDVQDLDCDFYVMSAHKMYGPTGIGVLWGREHLLDSMPPYQGGGEMISTVSFEHTHYAPLPYKFEAGTPNISGVIGLGAALDFLWSLNFEEVFAYEQSLLAYLTDSIRDLKGFNIIGTAAAKIPIVSFVHGKVHAHDIGTILDNSGIAIRAGHHCTMPLMDFYQVAATCRVSLSFYNTKAEIDRLIETLAHVKDIFGS